MGSGGSRRFRLPGLSDSRHLKVARLSALAPASGVRMYKEIIIGDETTFLHQTKKERKKICQSVGNNTM
jgi:hypothetical protein